MSRTAKIIIFSLVLLVAIINKQSNTSIISSSKQSTSTNKKDLSKPNELDKILQNQRQYSDKNVYNNVDQLLKDIIHEEN